MDERFYNETARIEKIIYLPGAVGDGQACDELTEFFQDQGIGEIEAIFGALPDDFEETMSDRDWAPEIAVEIVTNSKKCGFLALFATPVMEHYGNGTSYTWGFYGTKWIYGDTIDDLLDAGFAWVAECRRNEKQKKVDGRNA